MHGSTSCTQSVAHGKHQVTCMGNRLNLLRGLLHRRQACDIKRTSVAEDETMRILLELSVSAHNDSSYAGSWTERAVWAGREGGGF